MLKKMKAAAEDAPVGSKKDLSKSVLESSRQIWLAGLGAFSRAQQEGRKGEEEAKAGVVLSSLSRRVSTVTSRRAMATSHGGFTMATTATKRFSRESIRCCWAGARTRQRCRFRNGPIRNAKSSCSRVV